MTVPNRSTAKIVWRVVMHIATIVHLVVTLVRVSKIVHMVLPTAHRTIILVHRTIILEHRTAHTMTTRHLHLFPRRFSKCWIDSWSYTEAKQVFNDKRSSNCDSFSYYNRFVSVPKRLIKLKHCAECICSTWTTHTPRVRVVWACVCVCVWRISMSVRWERVRAYVHTCMWCVRVPVSVCV